jgi:FAD/FMN-containing dehydrogenase
VIQLVKFAHKVSKSVTIRGGGHSIVGNCIVDDAIMIDLSLMRAVTVDPATKTAYVQVSCEGNFLTIQGWSIARRFGYRNSSV